VRISSGAGTRSLRRAPCRETADDKRQNRFASIVNYRARKILEPAKQGLTSGMRERSVQVGSRTPASLSDHDMSLTMRRPKRRGMTADSAGTAEACE